MATPARANPPPADVAFERRALTLLAELSQALAVSVDIGETLHEAVNRIADCIQAMGANGLRAEYPLARHLAGAKIAAYTDGSIEMMNERIGAGLPAVFGLPT